MDRYIRSHLAVGFHGAAHVTLYGVKAFSSGRFSILFWAMWRTPTYKDPCFRRDPGEEPHFTTSYEQASLLAYKSYQEPANDKGRGPRLALINPSALNLALGGTGGSIPIALGVGQWHHIALVFEPVNSTTLQLTPYLDGEMAGPGSKLRHDEGEVPVPGHDLTLGRGYLDAEEENMFVGSLVEFQIWDEALTQDQIRPLMKSLPNLGDPRLRVCLPLTTDHMGPNGSPLELVGQWVGGVYGSRLTIPPRVAT